MLVKMNVPFSSESEFVLVDITRFFWGKPQSPNISDLTSAALAFLNAVPTNQLINFGTLLQTRQNALYLRLLSLLYGLT